MFQIIRILIDLCFILCEIQNFNLLKFQFSQILNIIKYLKNIYFNEICILLARLYKVRQIEIN